jgi:PAS domain S-box-containing protein
LRQPDDTGIPPDWNAVELFDAVATLVEAGLYVVNRERRILYWNRGAEQISGYLRQDVLGRLCSADILAHCNRAGSSLCGGGCPLASVIDTGAHSTEDLFLRHKYGHRIPVQVEALPLRDATGAITGAVEVFRTNQGDIREEIRALEDHGCLDPLTGAAVRRVGELWLRYRLAEMAQFGVPAGLVRLTLLDAEGLGHRYGHAALEALLALMSRTLRAVLPPAQVLVRWDELSFRVITQNRTQAQMVEMARMLAGQLGTSAIEWWGEPLTPRVEVRSTAAHEGDTLESLEARVS